MSETGLAAKTGFFGVVFIVSKSMLV